MFESMLKGLGIDGEKITATVTELKDTAIAIASHLQAIHAQQVENAGSLAALHAKLDQLAGKVPEIAAANGEQAIRNAEEQESMNHG